MMEWILIALIIKYCLDKQPRYMSAEEYERLSGQRKIAPPPQPEHLPFAEWVKS